MANALPLLLLGGAALLMMGGKKKPNLDVGADGGFDDDGDDTDDSEDSGVDEPQLSQLLVEPSAAEKCNMFIDSVWVDPEPGEISIKTLVVEESILPEMRSVAKAERKESGELGQDFVNTLIFTGLNAIAPDCGWVLTGDGWMYADSQPFEGKVLDVAAAMEELAKAVIEEANEPIPAGFAVAPPAADPDPQPADPPKFHIGT